MSKKKKEISEVPLSLKLIIQGLPELGYAFSKEGRLVAWNKNIEVGSGYSKEQLSNLSILDFVRQPDKEKVQSEFYKIFANVDGEEQILEFSVQSKSGNAFPVIGLRTQIVLDGKEYFIGIAVRKNKIYTEEDFSNQRNKISYLKNQLEDYYSKIEEMKHAQILLEQRTFFNGKDFNIKLINSLPGHFYMYEKVGDKFFLRRWNKNHETSLGYAKEELLNIQPHQLFTEKEYIKVEKSINQLFSTGSVQMKVKMTHKSGRQIPYFIESYIFEDKGVSSNLQCTFFGN